VSASSHGRGIEGLSWTTGKRAGESLGICEDRSELAVAEIRRRYATCKSGRALAREFGVSQALDSITPVEARDPCMPVKLKTGSAPDVGD
jgi:hypothetical protein